MKNLSNINNFRNLHQFPSIFSHLTFHKPDSRPHELAECPRNALCALAQSKVYDLLHHQVLLIFCPDSLSEDELNDRKRSPLLDLIDIMFQNRFGFRTEI